MGRWGQEPRRGHLWVQPQGREQGAHPPPELRAAWARPVARQQAPTISSAPFLLVSGLLRHLYQMLMRRDAWGRALLLGLLEPPGPR